ncbi:MAG: hypothetical protein JSV88_33705 [Candidatus Aminicenantes bacterium]|nr:MAG: hypothetical protein JSV88_33705 [Candidatus Aminicenantes bacterium]
MEVSRLRFYVVSLIFIILGLSLVFAGALTEPIIKNVFKSANWAINLFSIVLPLTGVTILGIFIPQLASRMGKYKSEFNRMKADAEYIAEEVSEEFKTEYFDYWLMKKNEKNRWCRWRGPISNVFSKREKDVLEELFKDAKEIKEIDILTPNLWEIYNYLLENPINPNAKVRMMSLHPECSAVYRRFNDMGESDEIGSRDEYSNIIRKALEGLHKKRLKNWQIRTYTVYPIIMIFRADNRFLLGFPLGGSRVRDQFHLKLHLPRVTSDEMKTRVKNKDIGNGTEIGVEIYDDLTRHFKKIWADSKPYLPWGKRTEIFKVMLETLPSGIKNAKCCNEFAPEKNKSFGELMSFIFSITKFKEHLNKNHCTLSTHQECIRSIVKEVVAININKASNKEKPYLDEVSSERIKNILNNFSEIIQDALEAIIEILERGDDVNQKELFTDKLTEKLSRGISKGKYEFEDLSEALFDLKNLIPEGDEIWRKVLKAMLECAEYWAR